MPGGSNRFAHIIILAVFRLFCYNSNELKGCARMPRNGDFNEFRQRYPVFSYDGFTVERADGRVRIRFDFSIPGLCEFHPETTINTDKLALLNRFDSADARKILFALGLVEAVSYWKCVCSPRFIVRCGALSDADKGWWKKLWYHGLGEFFYQNGIETSFEHFVKIECDFKPERKEREIKDEYRTSGLNIIPVGGGKDSCVTLDLLKDIKDSTLCFTVNDQPARTQTAAVAGYSPEKILKTTRQIDKELLQRNKEGFLNGHTPFSAIVAFLGLYCAHITGAGNMILSNESSANEATVGGTEINHQYSKSYAFEQDLNDYMKRNFGGRTNYFSLLRPFNELQIARRFAALKQFHPVFRSCNIGSKNNIWCGRCAKCLFVYIILSPFMERRELLDIFGHDMLEKEEMLKDFEGLAGLSEVKPFECVGTVEEVRCALFMVAQKYAASGTDIPFLLKKYSENSEAGCMKSPAQLLGEWNPENNVPEKFKKYITEMYDYVSATD